ncbi:hypothetical protein YC2023_076494 [Brassica napus]
MSETLEEEPALEDCHSAKKTRIRLKSDLRKSGEINLLYECHHWNIASSLKTVSRRYIPKTRGQKNKSHEGSDCEKHLNLNQLIIGLFISNQQKEIYNIRGLLNKKPRTSIDNMRGRINKAMKNMISSLKYNPNHKLEGLLRRWFEARRQSIKKQRKGKKSRVQGPKKTDTGGHERRSRAPHAGMGGCAADCPDPADITLSMVEESTPSSRSCSPYPRRRPAANNADFAKTKPTTVCSHFTQMSH